MELMNSTIIKLVIIKLGFVKQAITTKVLIAIKILITTKVPIATKVIIIVTRTFITAKASFIIATAST